MHLVDAHRRRRAGRVAARFASHSSSLPRRSRRRCTTRRGRRRCLGARTPSGRPCPATCAVRPEDRELVLRARRRRPGTKSSHTPLRAERAHRVAPGVPVVEVAGHPHAPGVRRPDRERRAGHGPSACRTCGRARRAPPTAARAGPRRSGAGRSRRASAATGTGRRPGALLGPALDPVRHLELVVGRRPGHQPGEHAAGVHPLRSCRRSPNDRGDPARRPGAARARPAGRRRP